MHLIISSVIFFIALLLTVNVITDLIMQIVTFFGRAIIHGKDAKLRVYIGYAHITVAVGWSIFYWHYITYVR